MIACNVDNPTVLVKKEKNRRFNLLVQIKIYQLLYINASMEMKK